MMWYSGQSWGWCSVMVNTPAMAVLWGTVFTALVLALRIALRRPSDPSAPTDTGFSRPEGVVAVPIRRSETVNEDFYRRLM